jgi:hypothetical protein
MAESFDQFLLTQDTTGADDVAFEIAHTAHTPPLKSKND